MDLEAMRPRAIRTLALAMRRRFWRWCSSSDRIPKQIRLPVGTTTAVPGQQSVAPSPGHCGTYEVGWEEDDGAPFWCDGSRKRKEVKLYFEKEDQPPVKAKQCRHSLTLSLHQHCSLVELRRRSKTNNDTGMHLTLFARFRGRFRSRNAETPSARERGGGKTPEGRPGGDRVAEEVLFRTAARVSARASKVQRCTREVVVAFGVAAVMLVVVSMQKTGGWLARNAPP